MCAASNAVLCSGSCAATIFSMIETYLGAVEIGSRSDEAEQLFVNVSAVGVLDRVESSSHHSAHFPEVSVPQLSYDSLCSGVVRVHRVEQGSGRSATHALSRSCLDHSWPP